MKDLIKTESHYHVSFITGRGRCDEGIEIVKNETLDFNHIQLKLEQDRWRTPKATVELLRKVADIIEDNFKLHG